MLFHLLNSHLCRTYKIMCNRHAKVEKEFVQFLFVLAVETTRGFIGKHHIGVVYKRTRYRDTLILAARHLGGFVMSTFLKPHHLQQLHCLGLGLGTLAPCYKCRNDDILQSGEFGQQLMELEHKTDSLQKLNPESILNRGYSILLKEDGKAVRSPDDAPKDTLLTAKLAKGSMKVRVE